MLFKNTIAVKYLVSVALLFGCAPRSLKVFETSPFEKVIVEASDVNESFAYASLVLKKNPKHFYGYVLLGDTYKYSLKFDSAAHYYRKADSIFLRHARKADVFERYEMIMNGSVFNHQSMLVRWVENELIRGHHDAAIRILEGVETETPIKKTNDSAVIFWDLAISLDLKRAFAATCMSKGLDFDPIFRKVSALNLDSSEAFWGRHIDIKAYIELYELTSKREYLDSARAIISRRDVSDKQIVFLLARYYTNMGYADSSAAVLSNDSSYYADYFRDRLKAHDSGKGFYNQKACEAALNSD